MITEKTAIVTHTFNTVVENAGLIACARSGLMPVATQGLLTNFSSGVTYGLKVDT